MIYGKGRNRYRILYTVRPSAAADEPPTVRVLHVRHGARQNPDSQR